MRALLEAHPRRRFGALAILAVALLAAACSGDDDDAERAEAAATAAAGSATATATAADADEGETPASGGFAGAGLVEGGGAFDWRVIRVDRGTKPDLALTSEGTPLVAYMLERMGLDGFINVAALQGEAFAAETVQEGYLYGPLDLEIGGDGTVALGYHNHDWEDAAVAIRGAAGWEVQRSRTGATTAGTTRWRSAPTGLHLASIDPQQFNSREVVEYATLEGGAWRVEAIGSGPQPYEWGTAIAVDAADVVHLVYFDAGNLDLVYARLADGAWTIEPIYEDGDAGRFPALALDASGRPHVAFYHSAEPALEEGPNRGSIVYGELTDGGWAFEVVVELDRQLLGFEGARRTVAIELANGEPVVAFVDAGRLGLASRRGGAWSTETLLSAGAEPFQVVGLALDGAGAPHLTFATVTGRGPLDGDIWYAAPVAKGAG